MLHVPYRGTAPALTDLLGGQVQIMFGSMLASIEYIKAGKLRAGGTDWQAASITNATAQHMMVRGLIERDRDATRYALTDQGAPCWRRCSRRESDERAL